MNVRETLLEQKVSGDLSPESQGCTRASLLIFHYELGIQTPLRTQAVRICLFTLLYNWQQRWEQLAKLILSHHPYDSARRYRRGRGISSGLKYIADTAADGTG